ncbi:MAG: leucine-rich repeat domain-containing protein [Candidatus Amulumruptor caecigallinarius]|nr:leucine-rich repeat domain-containing protein [Candidatus Amulumruptor caecigallinarius]MCM1397395.1 leucine-rich repeat domain-containing protein [Candidatus Amulumruptor caecigallinarius]MCM1454480.1 leucine-rich repeat domain-containing protein [bacterium]
MGTTLKYNVVVEENVRKCWLPSQDKSISGTVYIPAQMLFEYQDEVAVLDVQYISDVAFMDCVGITSVTIQPELEHIGVQAFKGCTGLKELKMSKPVAEIGFGAFMDCTNLEKVTLPNGLTKIPNAMFSNCASLTNIKIPSTVTVIDGAAFLNTNLEAIDIPNSVNEIQGSAFENCTRPTTIKIPNSVKSIGSRAFYGCSNLSEIELGSMLQSIGSECFGNCPKIDKIIYNTSSPAKGASYSMFDMNVYQSATLYLPSLRVKNLAAQRKPWSRFYKVKKIGQRSGVVVIHRNQELEFTIIDKETCALTKVPSTIAGDLDVPEHVEIDGTQYTVTEIEDYAFNECFNLESVSLPNTIESIGSGAFYDCLDLTEINMPASVQSIGKAAFYGCHQLSSIELPKSQEVIPRYLFQYCSNLKDIHIPSSFSEIGEGAFERCESLSQIELPNSIHTIGSSAFYGCKNLTSVNLPNAVSIGSRAFYYTALSEIRLPSKSSVGLYAFEDCENLQKVILEDGVARIEQLAFCGCANISSVVYNTDYPIEANDNIFDSNIYVTASLQLPSYAAIEASKTTVPWKNFLNVGLIGESSATPALEADCNTDIEVYNIQGMKIYYGPERLCSTPPGLYILIKNGKATKVNM